MISGHDYLYVALAYVKRVLAVGGCLMCWFAVGKLSFDVLAAIAGWYRLVMGMKG